MGSEARLLLDCDIAALYEAIRVFAYDLGRHDVAVFYFAGHGLEKDGTNWLLSIDQLLDIDDVPRKAISADYVLKGMQRQRCSAYRTPRRRFSHEAPTDADSVAKRCVPDPVA